MSIEHNSCCNIARAYLRINIKRCLLLYHSLTYFARLVCDCLPSRPSSARIIPPPKQAFEVPTQFARTYVPGVLSAMPVRLPACLPARLLFLPASLAGLSPSHSTVDVAFHLPLLLLTSASQPESPSFLPRTRPPACTGA
jgi:hypothetical protein